MLKTLPLLAALLPSAAGAHNWEGQEYWLKRMLDNHLKLGTCLKLVNENDIQTFKKDCSTWALGATENKVLVEYQDEKAEHPELSDYEFLETHFIHDEPETIYGILLNVDVIPAVSANIVMLNIVDGLTRGDK